MKKNIIYGIIIGVSLLILIIAIIIIKILIKPKYYTCDSNYNCVVDSKGIYKNKKACEDKCKNPPPGPPPSPSGDWVLRDENTQSDGVTHYWDCCKETCSWWNNAPDYGTNQCDQTGGNPIPADSHTQFPKSVCDKGGTKATCQNRYPEIVNTYNTDGSNTLMGFVATGKQLFPDFSPDSKNDYCGQCYEIEFYDDTLNNNTKIKNAVVQVTNTGDANGIFDFEVPGGGFGANNGCLNYSDWSVYTSQGGPCNANNSTCTGSGQNISGCAVYGGFQNQKYCDSTFGTDDKAKKSCNDILFGVFKTRDQISGQSGHCPGYPANLKIKKYRPVKCPSWHTSRTGSSKAPLAKRSKKIGDSCTEDSHCESRNCHLGKCDKGDLPDGNTCNYNKQCESTYCDISKKKCAKRPQGNVCYYNDVCMSGINKSFPVGKNISQLEQNCTPDNYCKKCTQIGMGEITHEFKNKNEKWNDIFKTDDEWHSFFNSSGGVTCPYLPQKYKKTCDRLNQQCGGNSGGGPDGNQPWDGPKYCGNSPGEKTNCNCVVVNDNYFQCKLKT